MIIENILLYVGKRLSRLMSIPDIDNVLQSGPPLQVTQYKGYRQGDQTVRIFWVVCHSLPKDAKKKLLGKEAMKC